jgi:ABC-type Fe3+/spermidine/putrescine transport system ATPase subunit
MASVQLHGVGKSFGAHVALLMPDRGTIRIDGEDVTRLPPHQRDLAMVFQSHALFPHMTVLDNVAFGLRMRGVDRRSRSSKAQQALELVGLGAMAGRYPHQLSGGQQQRVAIARALVVGPRVLLLDEPFGALDRKLRETMQHELRALTRRLGITAIFVTHDQEEALILSDSIAVMRDGRIDQQGTPEQIFEQPATAFVADFMGVQNVFEARLIRRADGALALGLGEEMVPIDGHHGLVPESGSSDDLSLRLGIRPERLRIVAAGQGLTAEVLDCTYAGVFRRWVLQHRSSTQRFVVHQPVAAEKPGEPVVLPAIGDTVGLAWDAASLLPVAR